MMLVNLLLFELWDLDHLAFPDSRSQDRVPPFQRILAGGAITILKNHGLRQWVSDDIPYMKWNIIQIFETTNQDFFCIMGNPF